MQHKIARGEYVGTVPFGYQLAADGVTLNEDTNEQEIISMIRELRGQGYSLRKIAAELDRQGIPTKQGASAWNAMTVRRICQAS